VTEPRIWTLNGEWIEGASAHADTLSMM